MISEQTFISSIAAKADKEQTHFLLLNGNGHTNAFPLTLALGVEKDIINLGFAELSQFKKEHKGKAIFGYFNYNLKNEVENLKTSKLETIPFDKLFFFTPKQTLTKNELTNYAENSPPLSSPPLAISLQSRTTKNNYISNVEKIKQHIINGDFYELNYCIEFYAENVSIDPASCYQNLINFSPTPFSVLLKQGDKYMIGASPERFIKKIGNKVISQPIKGTARRNDDPVKDLASKKALLASEKERAENLMIVDLVRNDLARSCQLGTIKVDKLFEIQSFKQVHQMVSTISAQTKSSVDNIDIIKNAFPMGSMTGAPKIKAMEIIDSIEDQARGLFSGSVGYFDEKGDFDFNVVIRSIFYDKTTKKLAFSVGSAITYDSDPEKEYEECLLKAEAIKKVLCS